MKNLRDIIRTVTNNGMSKRELFSEFSDPNSLQHKLVLGIADGTFKNDKEAIETLYNEIDSSSKKSYKQMKYNVRSKLLGLLFIMPDEQGSINSFRKAHAQALKLAAAGHIIFINSFTQTAEEVLVQAAQLAEEFEFFDIEYHALSVLESHYSVEGKESKRKNAKERCRFLLKMLAAISDSKEYYNLFAVIANTTNSNSDQAILQAQEVVMKLSDLAEDFPCFATRNRHFLALMYLEILKRDFEKVIRAIQGIFTLLQEKPKFATQSHFSNAYMQLGYSYYELKNYPEALKSINLALQNSKQNTYNWAVNVKYQILILLRLEDIPSARKALTIAQEYANEGIENDTWKEQIQLLHGYYAFLCFLLSKSGVNVDKPSLNFAEKFSLEHFMLNSKSLSRDKQGSNISRILLEILHLLITNPSGAQVKSESIRQYRKSYLKSIHHQRTNTLFQLLEILLENNYDLKLIERKIYTKLQLLEPSLENFGASTESIEPIEFRRLWQLIHVAISK